MSLSSSLEFSSLVHQRAIHTAIPLRLGYARASLHSLSEIQRRGESTMLISLSYARPKFT